MPICIWTWTDKTPCWSAYGTDPALVLYYHPNDPSLAPYCCYNRPLLLCLQPTDFCCFHKYKERTASVGMYRQRLRGYTRIRADTPMNTTLLLALYCHSNNPIASTVLLPTQTITVLMCLRSTDWPIDELYVRPLSPPDARIVLLPESDNCRACTPVIPIMVVPISLWPKHD